METINWKRKKTENHMQEIQKDDVIFLQFSTLNELNFIRHGFSTRYGGVSEGCFSSMNLSFHRGDEKEAVTENYRRITKALEMDVNNLVLSDQVHDSKIRRVYQEDCGKGICKELDYEGIDGLITNEPHVVLTTFFADCVPLFFADPVHKAIGLSHSGWRGTVKKMGAETLLAMKEAFGTKAEDVYAAIGPSICKDCYEVSGDVVEEFEKKFGKDVIKDFTNSKENDKFMLDLWGINRFILIEAGVLQEHIEVTDICTCCNPKHMFSHRASHGKRGNLAAFLEII